MCFYRLCSTIASVQEGGGHTSSLLSQLLDMAWTGNLY